MPLESVGAVPKVMSVALIVVVSINSTTVMHTYWIAQLSGRMPLESVARKRSFLAMSQNYRM